MPEFYEKLNIYEGITNFVFIGESGCGKSEIAVNVAIALARDSDKRIRFFDLDMTKPLFRSRDLEKELEAVGVEVFFEDQFMDAPTAVGGVRNSILDSSTITILDVGGDYIGARLIGGYAPYINRKETNIYYVVNPYRPWSGTIERVDGVLGQVLGSAHIHPEKIRMIANPNLGDGTDSTDLIEGWKKVNEMVGSYISFDFCVAGEEIPDTGLEEITVPILRIKRYFTFPETMEI